ncbi:MAG: aromatic amino acid transport family protein [Gammaproteobacteria bacterium]|nr:aromatic amino acid transport family protein [Gammaproteobacteria bacterium]
MTAKMIGGTLLVTGTAIGAGMLALPVATAGFGFMSATMLMLSCWAAMTAGAFLILEVTLWLPPNTNLVSMAGKTLGPLGQIVCWICYLLLLYALLAAYIAGGTDFLKHLLQGMHLTASDPLAAILFTGCLSVIVFNGIRAVDLVNRGLMLLKFITFFSLAGLLAPHVDTPALFQGGAGWEAQGMTVAITSFGFATIIPSLRNYFHGDAKKLRLVIFFGGLIPLICYILWNAVVMGVIPREGSDGLLAMLHSGKPTSAFITDISQRLQRSTITDFAKIFTSVCLLTSFLGVALCLADFLADGLGLERKGRKNAYVCAITFLPPLIVVLTKPAIFIAALSGAGILCIILLLVLPILMVWSGRYRQAIATGYRFWGGRALLILLLLFAAFVISQPILGYFHG